MSILAIIAAIVAFTYMDYQVKTKDSSLQGYFEYMKEKYWNKKDGK